MKKSAFALLVFLSGCKELAYTPASSWTQNIKCYTGGNPLPFLDREGAFAHYSNGTWTIYGDYGDKVETNATCVLTTERVSPK